MSRAARVEAPILVMHGSDDKICEPAASKAFVDRLSVSDKGYRPYPGLYHEIFNETARDAVLDDLAGWLSERVPG